MTSKYTENKPYPRPLKDSQCRGMVKFKKKPHAPKNPNHHGHTLSPSEIRARREARLDRSTKHMADPKRSVPADGPVLSSSKRAAVPGRKGGYYWLPRKNR